MFTLVFVVVVVNGTLKSVFHTPMVNEFEYEAHILLFLIMHKNGELSVKFLRV